MKYLLIAGLLTMCLAAGSGQTVEKQAIPVLSDTLIAEIKALADSTALDAAREIDTILLSKKVYPGKEENVLNWYPNDSSGTWTWCRYITYYRVLEGDSIFVEVKMTKTK